MGALALAMVFGWLNKRVPGSGGPYLYARDVFGDFGGFITSWSYWLTAWIGNAAIVVAWVGYVEVFINKGGNKWGSVAIALVGLWIPALIDMSGAASRPRTTECGHDARRPVRGGTAPPGHRSPARS
ncbi:MAG TPA: amino acid permease [Streptosporangiaceae bacterium]|nr:amino acid permease [Streptosporangiaceae bacterium]